ncbi:MAG TPA: hypothetical protein VLC28_09120 [Flavitalea sp.]|nr:hypothetical protein [Flavitalea sp.]
MKNQVMDGYIEVTTLFIRATIVLFTMFNGTSCASFLLSAGG